MGRYRPPTPAKVVVESSFLGRDFVEEAFTVIKPDFAGALPKIVNALRGIRRELKKIRKQGGDTEEEDVE